MGMVSLLFKWMLLMIRVSVSRIAKKHIMDKKSSTKVELIVSKNAIPQMLWTQFLINTDCFTINESVFFQDNICAILIDWDMMESRSKQTKPIRVIYFFY